MDAPAVPHLFVVKEPEPLGALFRPHIRDIPHLVNLLASGRPTGTGVILDGRYLASAAELRDATRTAGKEVVLDSLGVELFAPHGYSLSGMKDLPWAFSKRHTNAALSADEQRVLCDSLARAAVENRCTAVLAPTRFVQDIERDEVSRDVEVSIQLRQSLDRAGGSDIRVYYPLVTRLRVIASETARQGILKSLHDGRRAKAFDSIWIRAVGFDAHNSGPLNLRRYITGVRGFHELGIPVFGDRAGTVGLASLAFGITSGISSGITVGERYDPRALFKGKTGKGFLPAPRVYVGAIGAFMDRKRATEFLRHATIKNRFACQRSCCTDRGLADTLADPRRHFVVTRSEEVAELARVPAPLRAGQYMETWLRPASDRATQAMQIEASFEGHRKRLDEWRATLSAILEEDAGLPSKATRSPLRMPDRKGA
ncbi:MAG TPA: hypothetical protein VGQ52_00235 [Gemmatimonadaceae bacterium]|jgi:hypothetical protein|nr:hypothetical protein [Gemmatimonadaceae bacterium]